MHLHGYMIALGAFRHALFILVSQQPWQEAYREAQGLHFFIAAAQCGIE
jgi:hypothetical protein